MGEAARVPVRQLGPGGPQVPLFGLGSWNTWDRMDFDDAVALLRRAVDAGVTLFDVAHYNMGPHAEQARTDIIFGEAVRAAGIAREDYHLCGKLWLWEYPTTSFEQQMTTSLERIGIEKADSVVVGDYMSPPDIPSIVTDVAEQIRAGRFDTWGVNNWVASDLATALEFAEREGLTPPAFAQLKYSIARRTMAEGEFYGGYFSSGRLALQASDIFEGGILAGRKFPERKIGADPGGIRDAIREAADKVAEVAARYDASAAQVAIAFCLTNPAVANVLFGVSRLSQLEDNLGALRLAADHGAELRAALDPLWTDRAVNADGSW
ncbi:aryl-alcohol dehydrogenase-like predicted oxidoreductase [Saccharothrix tamanrassetensis]|uniref:Aryl-alcohol dehydrogenase-like predicted oxidoreductase n=1 Tax=Saccharothrix tamanrassetensis TaxID=1051531 RepID=A0A841C9P0_9PSEU|nr:aldo/keto reductase [Saccharothrix tamanrassetensis]MBB5953653.1 aryl-alcohol dehydrogenase-like predicted oxidoreductase [Saccharothrix tamanrassetensis]